MNKFAFSLIGLGSTSNTIIQRSITVDHTQIGTQDSANFPVLVSLTDDTLKTVSNSGKVQNENGYDINFYSDSGYSTLLNWEVELYDGVNGILIAWVKIPIISHLTDTIFYMKYGVSTITSFQGGIVGSTWNNNYTGVWHLPNGVSLSALDSTSNGNNGSIIGAKATAGVINGGASFVGATNQHISVGADLGLAGTNSNLTIKGWAYRANVGDHGAFVKFGNSTDVSGGDGFGIGVGAGDFEDSGNNLLVLYEGIRWLNTGQNFGIGWHQFAVTIDNLGKPTVYYDGVNVYSDSGTNANKIGSLGASLANIGGYMSSTSANRYWTGNLDEVQILHTQISSAWILAEYNNQRNPGNIGAPGFLTII